MTAPHLRVVPVRPALRLVPPPDDYVTLTCEAPGCEITRGDVDWCDHTSLCPEHRADRGCRYCQADARAGA